MSIPKINSTVASPVTQRFDYDVSNNVTYVGWADPGSLSSAAVWAVQRYTYTSGNVTLIEWASSGSMNNIWDNRTTLTYA